LSTADDDQRVPDLAEVDEDAPTNLHVPDLAGDEEAKATVLADSGQTPGGEAATIVSVDPAGARAGRDGEATPKPALGDPNMGFSSGTATDLVDVADPPEIETAPGPGREVAREIRLPDANARPGADQTGRVPSQMVAAPRPRGVTPLTLLVGAILFGTFVVVATFLIAKPDDTPEPEPEAPAPLAPVAVGEPSGTVYATRTEGGADLERRAADLVAAGRFSEAVGVYEAMLEAAPQRRELALALEVLRRRAAEGHR